LSVVEQQSYILDFFGFQCPTVAERRSASSYFDDVLLSRRFEFEYFQEGISVLSELIWHLETYDVTSVRASTPMYFMSRKIAELGVKVVLSGEGADEIFGGYLYFHNAPNDDEFEKVISFHNFSKCLRNSIATLF
uniref:Asparagine synthetase domain-containing protein n=1 Tax=Gongylonema pulchrum TaxID=637853 RepID=A0A183DHH0_9BILA